ncbi:MAG: IS701 family transposase [Candidatus Aenigmarchaeota archaeon]|nr:IS701 family transposase [Candidatus Aenigmarchaeota archaeon]
MFANLSIIPSLAKFRSLFTKPSFKHAVKYIHGLIAGERKRKNVKSINDMFLDRKDQSSMNRFLTKYRWDENELNHRRLRTFLIRKNGGVLIVDDSLIEKSGKRMEGVGFLFDHSKHKNILCHNIVFTHYVNGNEQMPMHLEPYLKKEVVKDLGKKFKTKIEIAIELLKKGLNYINPSVILFDAWYLAKKLVKSLKKPWISRVKTNRLVWQKDSWMPVKKLVRAIAIEKFRPVDIKISDKKYRWITSLTIKLKGIDKVKLVVLKKKINSVKAIVLATNLEWSVQSIVKTYKKRFCIDVFYRDCKQYLGLGEYQLRKIQGIVKHLFPVFLAYSLLKSLKQSLSGFVKSKLRTIGQLCRVLKQKILSYFVGWTIGLFHKVGSVDKVINIVIECLN